MTEEKKITPNEACDLVLSSKDKEIAELKEQLENAASMYATCSSNRKELESELSQLKEENKKLKKFVGAMCRHDNIKGECNICEHGS